MGEGRSRRDLLAATGVAVLVAGCGKPAEPAREPLGGNVRAPGDRDILAFALTLEYFEADFYERLVRENVFSGRRGELVRRFGEEEAEHVDALEATLRRLGGRPPDRPTPDFDRLLDGSPDAILRRTAEIEDLGAAAYLGQASRIQDRKVLAAALSIHAIEARHAAVLNHLAGQPFTPDGALASPRDRETVLQRVEELLA